MKLLNKIPLRLRLTFLATLVLTIACVLLTLSSVATYHNIAVAPGTPPVEVEHTIIEKHNGKIFIESGLGAFSKITVVLPEI